jgi:hypothetical protein
MLKISPYLVFTLLMTACAPPAKTAEPILIPSPTARPAGVMLTYEENAQVELVTPGGRHIYITAPSTT